MKQHAVLQTQKVLNVSYSSRMEHIGLRVADCEWHADGAASVVVGEDWSVLPGGIKYE